MKSTLLFAIACAAFTIVSVNGVHFETHHEPHYEPHYDPHYEPLYEPLYEPQYEHIHHHGHGHGNNLRLEDLGGGYMFLCDLIPSIDCNSILNYLPHGSTASDAAAIIALLASNLRTPGLGGVVSQNPVARKNLSLTRIGEGYAFACDLIPGIDCDAIIQNLPPCATEGEAAAEVARHLAALKLPRQFGVPEFSQCCNL